MSSLKHMLTFALLLLVLLFVAACGSNSSSSGNSSYSYGNGGGTNSNSNAAADSSAPLLKTAPVTVKGKSETVLTNNKGMTLYYFTADTTDKSACTGACAGIWPSLNFTGSGTPTSATPLTGKLSTLSGTNQVTYNGHPLYTFAKDTAPGQAAGEGIAGKWFVVSPDLKELTAPSSSYSNGY